MANWGFPVFYFVVGSFLSKTEFHTCLSEFFSGIIFLGGSPLLQSSLSEEFCERK